MKLLIYMPALNEEKHIQEVISDLPQKLDDIDEIQYLVVDDGSTDKTKEIAHVAGAQVISHKRNLGVGAAFHSAVQFALENDADILVGIDADGQFDSNEIPYLLQPIFKNSADMVVGNRFVSGQPKHMSPIKYWGNKKIAQLVSKISGQVFQDVSCGFRAYSREALFRLNIFGEFTYTHETILTLVYQGLRVVERTTKVRYFPERKSRVASSISHYAIQTSKIILRAMLDYRPIQIFGTFGSICFVIGTGFEIFLFTYYIFTHNFTPYKTAGFIGLGFIIFGTLVLLLALIADMLNRQRINQDRLLYEIKQLKYEKEK